MAKRRRGRTGQTYTASPRLPSYDLPPASEVTIQRPDGSTETQPAQKPKRTPRPQRRRRPNGPLVCAICGYPIEGQAATSTEHRSRGKPIHPLGKCIEPDRTKKPVKDPGAREEIPKQLEQEKAHRVIGKSGGLISLGDEGSDEGLRPVGHTPRREKSISEETNRDSPPAMLPSGRNFMSLRLIDVPPVVGVR